METGYKEKYSEIFNMNKNDLLYLIEELMKDGKMGITDIAICHTKALESKLAEKDEIIHNADNCIFESVFTDSLGKPADDKAMQRKLEWLDKIGTHNMERIMTHIETDNPLIQFRIWEYDFIAQYWYIFVLVAVVYVVMEYNRHKRN